MPLSARKSARDISYATAVRGKGARALIRLIENSTGRLALIKRAQGYEREMRSGRVFFDVMMEKYGLSLEVTQGSLAHIPCSGPLILVSNHPYGLLDGLTLGHMLAQRRHDFKILTHAVFGGVPDLARYVLPISFEADKQALALNLSTRKQALGHLEHGGAIGIFPGGTVSTAIRPFAKPFDPTWRRFTGRMIEKSQAQVVPVYFDGQTSRLFQIASHLHHALRMGLMMREFRSRLDTPVRVAIGHPVDPEGLAARAGNSKAIMAFLRKATYEMSAKPDCFSQIGFDFERDGRA
ncbi:MAG: lysophospholipid acyltransferase family protein [Pseudomonadota bacterium]